MRSELEMLKPFFCLSAFSPTWNRLLRLSLVSHTLLATGVLHANNNLSTYSDVSQAFCNSSVHPDVIQECLANTVTDPNYVERTAPLAVLSFHRLIQQQDQFQLNNLTSYLRERRFSAPLTQKNENSNQTDLWSVFLSGGKGQLDQNTTGYELPLDTDLSTISIGLDAHISPEWFIGATLGQTDAEQNFQVGNSRSQTDTLILYSSWYRRSFAVDTLLGLSRGDLDLQRAPADSENSNGSTKLNTHFFKISGTFDFSKDNWVYGPLSSFHYENSQVDNFLESGNSIWSNSYQFQDSVSSVFSMGGHIAYTQTFQWGHLAPYAQIEWQTQLADDPDAIRAELILPPSSEVDLTPTPYDSSWYLLKAGIAIRHHSNLSGSLNYMMLSGHDQDEGETIQLNINWLF